MIFNTLKIGFSIMSLLLATTAFAQPVMRFDSTLFRYGTIPKGDSNRTRQTKVWNDAPQTGNSQKDIENALIIRNVAGSCGCTAPYYTKEPILPGQYGIVGVNYDTQRIGFFTKTLTVTANDPKRETTVIVLRGNVYELESRPSAGVLELPVTFLDAGTIMPNDSSQVFVVPLKNTGSESIKIEYSWIGQGTLLYVPRQIPPHETVELRFRMRNEKSPFYKGEYTETLRLQTNTAHLPQGESIQIKVNRL